MQASEAIKALGNAIDSFILGLHVALYSGAGSAGTTPFATNIAVANTARKLLNKELAPVDDRRVVLAWLTDEGKGMKRRLLPVMEKLLKEATVGISEKELEITRETLSKFQTNLSEVLERTSK